VVEYLRVFSHVVFFGLLDVNNLSKEERNVSKRIQAIAATVLAGCVVLGGTRSAFCQQRQAGAPAASTSILRSSAMMGSAVNFRDGSALGKVTDFVINDGGCVQYVVVGYQNRFVPVPWMAATYNSADRSLMLAIDQAQLAQIPTFGQYSELSNAQFGQKVNTFFKVDARTSEQRVNKPVSDDKSGASKPAAQTDSPGPKPAGGTKPSADNKPEGVKQPAAAEKQAAPRKTHG
jgi:hypothetical protein